MSNTFRPQMHFNCNHRHRNLRPRSLAKQMSACLLALGGLLAVSAQAQIQIAFTWDDLPAHSRLPPGVTRQQVIDQIISAIKAENMPAPYGFVNGKAMETDPANIKVLDAWRAAGFPLGNHTFEHTNLNTTSLEAWEEDVLRDEPVLAKEMGSADFHWLRYPNLAEGNTPQKRLAARTFLADHGYKIAGVTESFADYAFNEPYARCAASGNEEAISRLERSYLQSAQDNLEYVHQMAQALYGRDIPYILLMHVGALDARLLPRLIQLYRSHGVTFVSLQQAVQDPFYKNDLNLQLDPVPDTLEEAMGQRSLPLPRHASLDVDLNKICGNAAPMKRE